MLADTIQKSVLEWLQLTPELLSGLPRRALTRAKPPAAPQPAAAPAVETAQIAAVETAPFAAISTATVLPSVAMAFIQAAPAPAGEGELWQQVIAKAYPANGRAYAFVESGGTQRAALSEMTGYLSTRLQPEPSAIG